MDRAFLISVLLFIGAGAPSVFAADAGFKGEYFNNPDLSGTPALVRTDDAINFDWSHGSPDPSISADLFSIRWTKNENFETGNYRFSVTSDDGVRLYLDNNLILDKWFDHMITTDTVDQQINAGTHSIKMEFYERYEAGIAKLSYTPVSTSSPSPQPTSTPTPAGVGPQGELPKTGLPALAWVTVALIPVGLKMRRFYKVKGELTDSPNYLWEERQFKVGA